MVESDIAAQEIARLAEDFRHVFGSEAGKRVLAEIDGFCLYVNTSTFVSDDPGGRISAYNEGLRDVANRIHYLLEVDMGNIEQQLKGVDDE